MPEKFNKGVIYNDNTNNRDLYVNTMDLLLIHWLRGENREFCQESNRSNEKNFLFLCIGHFDLVYS